MKLSHTPQAVALDQLAAPMPETYAFEAVTQRGDLDNQVKFGVPHVVTAPMSEILGELYVAKSRGSLEQRYWHPARAVFGVIGRTPRDLLLLTGATRVALEMYAHPPLCESLAAFDEDITKLGLRDMVVSHEGDQTTQRAEAPHYSRLAAIDIANDIGAPALFLANCHGGLIPAIQTALTYERTVPGNRLFPIKFSIYKSKSQSPGSPEMSPEELRLIAEASEDMPVIVYDDDAGGGHTLRHLVRYLGAHLPAGRDIFGYVSLDERTLDARDRQGERWEHSLTSGL